MSVKRPRSMAELLQSGDISRLGAEAAARRELAGLIRRQLPKIEANHVVSAHIDAEGRLVIGMDSAAWAARLRYLVDEIDGRPVRVRVAAPRGLQGG